MKLTTVSNRSRSDLLRELVLAKQNAAQATKRLAEIEAELTQRMRAREEKTLEADVAGTKYRVTYVQTTRVNVDERGLFEALGDKAPLVQKHTLDRKALEEKLDSGEVDAEVVSKFLTESHGKPYLRVSESEADKT